MSQGSLLIGQRRYSSWSLRGWLAVRLAGLDVTVEVVRFTRPGNTAEIGRRSPNALVPYLEHDGARVWESLAVVEYCAEQEPALWPRRPDRACRGALHRGRDARRVRRPAPVDVDESRAATLPARDAPRRRWQDIARIEAMWREVRAAYGAGGPYLFGAAFTGADVMFAPVGHPVHHLAAGVADDTAAYCTAVSNHPLMQEWYDEAAREPESWCLPDYETA